MTEHSSPWQQGKERVFLWLCLVMPMALLESLTPLRWSDLRFQREQILGGEWWRIWTGHIDHLGWNHLALNAIFLALCLVLFKPLYRFKKTLLIWFLSVTMISIGMLIFSPNMVWYVGLSSSLYSLLIVGASLDKQFSAPLRLGFIGLVVGKVWLEQGTELAWIANLISGPVSELSHLYGVAVGLILAGVFKLNELNVRLRK